MAYQDWKKVREVFDAALRLPPDERQRYINQSCGHDYDLLTEVESLFSSLAQSNEFLETPAVAHVAEMFESSSKPLEAGTRLEHYEVIRQIGVGGMGEVYLAQDLKLNRWVAIKILNEQFSRDESNLKRFVREARAASALNHPNILVIHEIGESEAAHYIVSEFIEGKTLREVLNESQMGAAAVLEVAIEIASALSAAHRAHLVHCDIKPENVMVRPDGYVKVLDFGLAKLVGHENKSLLGLEDSGSRNQPAKGLILGTVNYMSPEQAKGEPVDERTDIFSFGVVIYEMLVGETPFAGNSVTETLTNLLSAERQPHFPAEVPDEIRQIVSRMLLKNKQARYQTMTEVLTDLKGFRDCPTSEERPSATGISPATMRAYNEQTAEMLTSFSRQTKRYQLLAILAVGALLIGFFVWRTRPKQTETVRFLKPTQVTTWTSLDIYPSFSPDGSSIAYSSDQAGNFEIYVKQLNSGGNAIQLTSDGQQNFQPAFSPDGKSIAFYSKTRGGIWLVPAAGGKARQITTFGSRPAWSPDGRLIAFQLNPITDLGASALPSIEPSTIWIVAAQGGEPRQITRTGNPAGGHGSPSWSPDGQRIVFCASNFVLSSVWTVASNGTDLKEVARGYLTDAVYSQDGKSIYYGSDFGLWRIGISPATGAPIGESVEVANTSPARLRHFAVSADGKKIAYAALLISSNIHSIPISPATNERTSESLSLTQNRSFRNAFTSFSPDGKKLAYQSFNIGGTSDVWIMDADGKNATQVTSKGGFCPSWFQSGHQILFSSNREGEWKAWIADLKSGQDKLLLDFGEEDVQYIRLSPDARHIAFNSKKSGTINVAIIPTAGGAARQITFDKELAGFAGWSPDGKLLALQIKRGDDSHVAIMPSSGGEITQLTSDKGQSWAHSFSPDGDKIVFAGFRNGVWNLYWVSRTTKQQKQLTHYTKLNSYVRYPTWSPLGDQIAFEYAETTGNIWIADLKQ